jgi:hypothetical protein
MNILSACGHSSILKLHRDEIPTRRWPAAVLFHLTSPSLENQISQSYHSRSFGQTVLSPLSVVILGLHTAVKYYKESQPELKLLLLDMTLPMTWYRSLRACNFQMSLGEEAHMLSKFRSIKFHKNEMK